MEEILKARELITATEIQDCYVLGGSIETFPRLRPIVQVHR